MPTLVRVGSGSSLLSVSDPDPAYGHFRVRNNYFESVSGGFILHSVRYGYRRKSTNDGREAGTEC
jgi:hypothetical protein